eukprot:comp7393_c0_seq2/m.3078 comp7393_c0_seq2/g.3078  ORF comp7393_c0_seq2/g.3078 comp7393_c0_seq2/m.3078 type:complete len:172 (-) comp7393_c0_seq2:87-602(-)
MSSERAGVMNFFSWLTGSNYSSLGKVDTASGQAAGLETEFKVYRASVAPARKSHEDIRDAEYSPDFDMGPVFSYSVTKTPLYSAVLHVESTGFRLAGAHGANTLYRYEDMRHLCHHRTSTDRFLAFVMADGQVVAVCSPDTVRIKESIMEAIHVHTRMETQYVCVGEVKDT